MQPIIHYPKIRIGKYMIDIFPYWVALLLVGIVVGLVAVFLIFAEGLYITDLSNQVPWGLWITIDLSAISLGGSAFVLGILVYLLKIKRFEKVGKLAIVLGFLGYTTAGMVLLLDLGRPLRFWHPLVYWQPDSLLWGVTICVVIYVSVLSSEVMPIILEHPAFSKHPLLDRFPILRKLLRPLHVMSAWTHKLAPALAVVALTLSLLHQAFYGAVYSVLAGRGLWFNQSAPVQFVLSAMGGGLALLFILSIVVFRIMRPGQVKDEIFYDLARLAGGITLLLTYLRVWDWAVTNFYSFDNVISLQTQMLNTIAPFTLTFWLGQVLLPVAAGAVLLAAKSVRSFRILLVFATIPVFNVILMRWNYNFAGLVASITYDPFTPTVVLNSYTPTWVEFAVGGMVICYALLMFTLAARYLPFKAHSHAEH